MRPRILDRYVIREVLPPLFLSLLIFTFILEIPPVMDQLESLVAKGVSWGVAARIMLTLDAAGPGPHDPDGAAGRPADRARTALERPRSRRPPGLRRQSRTACCGPVLSWPSSPPAPIST